MSTTACHHPDDRYFRRSDLRRFHQDVRQVHRDLCDHGAACLYRLRNLRRGYSVQYSFVTRLVVMISMSHDIGQISF